MLAAVFSMQSFGQLFGAVVTVSAVRCGVAFDSGWRLVYGVATVPAAVALFLRFSIPESPRYTFDVARNPDLANFDLDFTTGNNPLVVDEGGQAVSLLQDARKLAPFYGYRRSLDASRSFLLLPWL
jgi:hypothetical protein